MVSGHGGFVEGGGQGISHKTLEWSPNYWDLSEWAERDSNKEMKKGLKTQQVRSENVSKVP